MTLEEARKVALICEGADGNCCVCVEGLALELGEAFPEFKWTFEIWDDDNPRPDFDNEHDNCNRIFVTEK